jgi:hypothetical protein
MRDTLDSVARNLLVEPETDFQRCLKMMNTAVFDMTGLLHHFKPANVLEGSAGLGDRIFDRIVIAGLGRTDDFNYFVSVLAHYLLPVDKWKFTISSKDDTLHRTSTYCPVRLDEERVLNSDRASLGHAVCKRAGAPAPSLNTATACTSRPAWSCKDAAAAAASSTSAAFCWVA